MNQEQRNQLTVALRRGSTAEDKELDDIIADDIFQIEELLDKWIVQARDWYFGWTVHRTECPSHSYPSSIADVQRNCTCGLTKAIIDRRKV